MAGKYQTYFNLDLANMYIVRHLSPQLKTMHSEYKKINTLVPSIQATTNAHIGKGHSALTKLLVNTEEYRMN